MDACVSLACLAVSLGFLAVYFSGLNHLLVAVATGAVALPLAAPMPTLAGVKALAALAAAAILFATNPTRLDHYHALEDNAGVVRGILQIGASSASEMIYSNYIVFSTLKFTWRPAQDPAFTIGFLGKVFVMRAGSG